jgi:uncharacterized membrane protein YraQ (UPF0718 family)
MIKSIADFLTFSFFGIKEGTYLAEAVNFFIYDIGKIFILLLVIIFTVSFIRSYVPPEKIRNILSEKNKYLGYILAGFLGMLTPFCSCSAIPMFLGFIEAGVPLGVTFTFLVASPLINEVALILLLGLFGWRIALLYIGSGFLIAIIAGLVIERFKPEKLLADFMITNRKRGKAEIARPTFKERVKLARSYTKGIIIKIWIYIVIGVAIGAFIHGYVPTDFLVKFAGKDSWYSVPIAVMLGIPLYSNAAGTVPLVAALTEKGMATGTALAFMMSVVGLSLPEFLILKKAMKTKLLIIFGLTVGLGILTAGYLFNFLID